MLNFKSTPNFKNSVLFDEKIFFVRLTQNTLWLDSDLFPLLYLPSTVSLDLQIYFRYIAQSVINSSSKNWGFSKLPFRNEMIIILWTIFVLRYLCTQTWKKSFKLFLRVVNAQIP